MVKKIILELNEPSHTHDPMVINKLLQKNMELQCIITKYKDKITEYYKNKTWDRYKKLSNEYEMIFTTPNNGNNISDYNPVSRSFFKMWEILHDFREELSIDRESLLRVCMLCEGPGGFAEAIIKYRGGCDEYHGISLKSNNNKNIPDWKTSHKDLNKVKICYGADGTGNIYNMANITYLVSAVGKQSIDLITADGGFDFSSDFNNQEELSIQLIYSEILATLLLQKEGGSFVLKIYDIYNENSLKMLHILKHFYKHIHIVKPLTSRPANSEKYLVCTGFSRGVEFKKYYEILYKLVLYQDKDTQSEVLKTIEYDEEILRSIITYNAFYTMRQIYYIQRTIDYINTFKSITSYQESKRIANNILEEHKRKSLKWCRKYKIHGSL